MMKIKFLVGVCATAIMVLFHAGSGYARGSEILLPVIFDASYLSERFGKYYEPVRFDVNPGVPSYSLPLKADQIHNYSKFLWVLNQKGADKLLFQNGFVTAEWGRQEDVVEAYKQIKKSGFPVFVTSDSLLHLYHIHTF